MSRPAHTADSPRKGGGATRVVRALALLSGVLAVLLIGLGVVGLARVATPNMQGFNAGATVTITDSGASIYARSDTERTATVCAATKDSTSTTLDRPTSAFSVDVSQSDFFEVARTPDSLEAGTYSVSCEGTTAALYVGPSAPSTSASGLLGPAGLIAGVILAVVAIGLGILAFVLRSADAKKAAGDTPSYGATQSGYSSPYASPPPPSSMGQQPYSQAPYGDQSQQGSYGQQPQGDPYGQGRFDQPAENDEHASRPDGGHDDNNANPPPPA